MPQIVHDLAPHASLAFATAFESEESFAHNIEALARPVAEGGAGAKVIVDDVAYFEEPFFQDGPVAAAVNKVTAEGVTYFSAAGNDNLFRAANGQRNRHRLLGSAGVPRRRSMPGREWKRSRAGFNGTHCMDFDPGADRTSTTPSGSRSKPGATLTVDLQWAEPWNGVSTDLDAFLLDSSGKLDRRAHRRRTSANRHPAAVRDRPVGKQKPDPAATVRTRRSTASPGASPGSSSPCWRTGRGVSDDRVPSVRAKATWSARRSSATAGAAGAIAVGAVVPFDDHRAAPSNTRRAARSTHYFDPVGRSRRGSLASPRRPSPSRTSPPPTAARRPSSPCHAKRAVALLRHLGRGPARGRGRRADAGQANPWREPRRRSATRCARPRRRSRRFGT